MTTLADRVRAWIAQGEGRTIEFKLRPTAPEKMAVECAALANSGGGHLLVGVRDNREIAGCSLTGAARAELVERIQSLTQPPVPVRSEVCRIDGRRVVVLTVDGALSPPYTVATRTGRRRPVRAGECNREASDLMVRGLSNAARGRHDESLPVRVRELVRRQGRFSVAEYAHCCNFSMRRAHRELVRLVKEGRLTHWVDGPHEYYC